MNKIRFEIDPNINYLYHMLSVARCGYDNDYGRRYRPLSSARVPVRRVLSAAR